ncbi:hypothetical protein HMPREF2596_02200 [Neisseria sp. HMSC078C12]|nr:hypothetical protein HMPREF2596_02200 [Neisseria sp. HMSC078C12]
MIRAFEYLTNLAVRCPLTNPLPRGEGIRLLKIRERRIENQMVGKPENVRVWQLNPLSPWERARERAQAAGLPLWQKIRPCPPNKSIPKSIFMQNQAKP